MDVARLQQFPVLAALPADELELLAGALVEEAVDEGRVLARAGDFGYALYAVEEGSADVVGADGEVVRSLAPGDTFGEIALVQAGRRSATVVARTPMRLLALFTRDFQRLRSSVPGFEAALRAVSTERLGS